MRAVVVVAVAVALGAAALALHADAATVKQRHAVVAKLKRGPLAEHAWAIEAAAHRHGVSPFAIVAISGKESSFGAASCRSNPRNIWGLGACDRAWQVPYFNTWREAFNYFASFLRRTWPSARTVYELYGYAGSSTTTVWAPGVAAIMRQLYGVGSCARYP